MATGVGKTAVFALVATLAVTAGCQGVLTEDGTGTRTGGSAAKATDVESVDTDRVEANTSETGTATNAATGTATTAGGSNLTESHLAALRAAGSVTVNTTIVRTVDDGNETNTLRQVQIGRIDFESGRAYARFEPFLGGPRERYRNESGATFTRTGTGDYFGPDRSDAINVTRLAGITSVEPDAIERHGAGTVDGVSGTVYTVDSATVREYSSGDIDPENVSASDVTYVVDDAGYMKYMRMNVTIEVREKRVTQSARRRFTEVGSTTVSEPGWLDEAEAVAVRPGPDDVVTRTYNATGEDGQVEMDVTAAYGELEGYATVGPEISENPVARNEFLNRYRVGEVARYYFRLETVEAVTIRVHYDDAAVDDANESTLRLAMLNLTTMKIEPVDSTVDTTNDTVSATITGEAAVDRYQGKPFLLLRWPQYVSGLQERDGRMDSGQNSLAAPGRETGGV